MGDGPERVDTALTKALADLEASLASPEQVARWERRCAEDRRLELLTHSGAAEVLTGAGSHAVVKDTCERTRALDLVSQWLATEIPILALFGGVGTGKTMAAAWALARMPGRYVEAGALCAMYHDHYGEPGEAYFTHAKTGLLVIDELGAERDASKAVHSLHDVINRRQKLPRRTLLLGNLTRQTFDTRYDTRSLDRLKDIARVMAVRGESMRGKP